ncbi:MAG: 23S rRNA (uracil(1939)-C(5))-methyltransferase RlmD [Deltaproteobacteria bacterium]|nr:23S rRNA (uracil(1939)-C(5))-methyltransferase RlmD [Deltaproteobacteria bacterium]TLN02659.1 MAG: 23S rRNA (uracil(1939)-C(5))-methyltransferase RlmD [bacterium]
MNRKKIDQHPKPKKPHLVKGQALDLTIANLDEDGYGLAEHEGTRVRVTGAFPGEQVRARITFSGQRDTFADTFKITRKSPERLAVPPCAKATSCDGCPLIQMKYQAQLDWKKGLVEGVVRRYPSLRDTPVHPVLPSKKPLAYRTTAKLVIAGKFAEPKIGIYLRNTHEVIDLGDCQLHHPIINRITAATREGIRKGKIPIYNPKTGNGLLRYLVVRVSEHEERAMAVFVTSERSFNEIHHLIKFLQKAVPEVTVVAQNVNSSSGNAIFGDREYFVTKQQTLTEKLGDIRFSISPRSFFQINSDGAQTIYNQVKQWAALSGKESVVDVYCGVGGISLFLAGSAREILGIESVEAAVADAEKNARLNGIRNCQFEAGDAAELLSGISEEGFAADIIVLNPPRKGCDEEVLRSCAHLKPKRIIYVSCSPVTLARDLNILKGLGYRTSEIQPVDMFPQTTHVENVALLEREHENA